MPTTYNPDDPLSIAPGINPAGNGLLNTAAPLPPAGGTPPAGGATNSPATTYTPATGTPGIADTSTYTATPYKVEKEGLVEERIKGIVAADSPLMQQAKGLADARSNERGLLNSSIGTSAAQSAVIGAAAPIATTDAGAINAAMTNTANAQNAAGQFNTGQENENSRLNANLLSQMNSVNANAQNAALNLQAQAQNAQIMSRLDHAQKVQMQEIMNANQLTIQQNTAAAQLAQQTMTNIANIQMSTSLDATQKANAIAGQLNLMNESLRATDAIIKETPGQIASLGITDLFGGGNASPENIAGSGNTKSAKTAAEAKQNEASLRASYTDLRARAEAELAKARAIPDRAGGKAERAPFVAAAAEFKRQAALAAEQADKAMVEGIRLGTPDQYQSGLAGYQAQLDQAKAAFAATPTSNTQEIARQRAAIDRYTTIVNGLKTAGYPTQAAMDAKVNAVYKTYTIPTYTTSADAKTGYDKVSQMVTAETDPVKRAALLRARDQIGLDRINKFYSPSQKTAAKAQYASRIAAEQAKPQTAATRANIAYYTKMRNGIT